MIGVLGQAGRVVGSQILRQTGREIGEEALRRLLAREGLEGLTRDQLKLIGKRGAQHFIRELGKGAIDDYKKKNENWNDRMNDFTRNLNKHFKQHRTLYAEERNIANKEKLEDRRGLWNAYNRPNGIYKTGKTLYISGTGGKDGSITQDVLDDLLLVPTRNVHHSEKYKDAMKAINESPEVSRLVGHSLASAVINQINNENPNKYSTTTYATPTIKPKRKGKQNPLHKDFRNKNDIVSALEGYAITNDSGEWNPLMAHSYINFEGQGLYNINPGTRISNGFDPNNS